MDGRPEDLDAARRAIADKGLVAAASGHITTEVAVHLPLDALASFKTALKRLFSPLPWTDEDAAALADLVSPHVDGWWEHDLGEGLRLAHGLRDGRYVVWVSGADEHRPPSVFTRVFSGPVVPEQTPHPRKVKFTIGGAPAPGVWYRKGEDVGDPGAAALLDDKDVTDVMVAGDFVTVGLRRGASWEERLDDLLDRVTELFWAGTGSAAAPPRTRDELLEEGRGLEAAHVRPEDLHLMDPNRDDHLAILVEAVEAGEARARRAAVATLVLAGDDMVVHAAVTAGVADPARSVRRATVDAVSDLEDERYRPIFEAALGDEDAWIRWKAVRSLRDLGPRPSEQALEAAAQDDDFRVRFEAEAALREI
jgi:hypothetical protein